MTMLDERVKLAYQAWEESRTKLREAELALEGSIESDKKWRMPPFGENSALDDLRVKTDVLFNAALSAVRERAAASREESQLR